VVGKERRNSGDSADSGETGRPSYSPFRSLLLPVAHIFFLFSRWGGVPFRVVVQIAKMIPGRKDDQCAKRWKEVLDPSLSKVRLFAFVFPPSYSSCLFYLCSYLGQDARTYPFPPLFMLPFPSDPSLFASLPSFDFRPFAGSSME